VEEELRANLGIRIEGTDYRDLTFDKMYEGPVFKDHETGVYICRQAEIIAEGKDARVE
jgi:hypothetical protein